MKTVDLTGTWEAQMTATGGTQRLIGFQWTAVITVVQTGSAVSGKFETDMGLSGEVTGNIFGDQVSMTIHQGPICPGTFHGSAKVTRKKMIGTYSGSDCNGPLEASFTASKAGMIGLVGLGWECACGIENSYSRSSCSNCKWTREQSEKWKEENPKPKISIRAEVDEPSFKYTGMIITLITLVGFAYSTCIKPHCGRKAAEQGNPGTRRNHSLIRTASKGIKQDYVFSHMGLNLATSRFPASAGKNREKNGRSEKSCRLHDDSRPNSRSRAIGVRVEAGEGGEVDKLQGVGS